MERFTRPLMERVRRAHHHRQGRACARARSAAFSDLGGVYLAVIGGAAALETTWVEQIEDVDLDDLNPESLWKFRVKGFGPLLVSMDSHGGSLYTEVNSARAREARRCARCPRRETKVQIRRREAQAKTAKKSQTINRHLKHKQSPNYSTLF